MRTFFPGMLKICLLVVCGLIFLFSVLNGRTINSEITHCGPAVTYTNLFKVQRFTAVIADAELKGYRMQTGQYTLPPGGSDTISHRHDCEIFVIVLSGTLEMSQNYKDPVTLHEGEVFYEARNITHTMSRNPDPKNPANMMLVYLIKEGRQFYTPLYPKK